MGVHLLKPLVGAIVIALTLAGCSDSSSPPPPATTAPLPTLENAPTRQSTTPSTPGTPSGSSTPGESPTTEPTAEATPTEPASSGTGGSVIDAATAAFGAVYRPELTRDSCNADNPDLLPCVSLSSAESTVESGVARFTGGYPDGGGFSFYMGRQSGGEWGYWFGTQQQLYQLVTVPGELRACGGGNEVVIRSEPASTSEAAGSIADGSTVSAQEFLLTVAGSPSGGRGEGWYRVGGETPGWISATQSSDAGLGGCELRDAIEGESPRG